MLPHYRRTVDCVVFEIDTSRCGMTSVWLTFPTGNHDGAVVEFKAASVFIISVGVPEVVG